MDVPGMPKFVAVIAPFTVNVDAIVLVVGDGEPVTVREGPSIVRLVRDGAKTEGDEILAADIVAEAGVLNARLVNVVALPTVGP